MAVTVQSSFDYDAPADRVWADLISYDALAKSMKGSLTYIGLPDGEAQVGDDFEVELKIWGWLPVGRWRMRVVERDDASRVMRSEEGGGVVRRYHHRLMVKPTGPATSCYEDLIELEAGLFTGFYRRNVERMYHARHRARATRLAASA